MNNLFRKTDRESIMKQWDYWRSEIANGHKGTAPRDWFESILDYFDDNMLAENECYRCEHYGGLTPDCLAPSLTPCPNEHSTKGG